MKQARKASEIAVGMLAAGFLVPVVAYLNLPRIVRIVVGRHEHVVFARGFMPGGRAWHAARLASLLMRIRRSLVGSRVTMLAGLAQRRAFAMLGVRCGCGHSEPDRSGRRRARRAHLHSPTHGLEPDQHADEEDDGRPFGAVTHSEAPQRRDGRTRRDRSDVERRLGRSPARSRGMHSSRRLNAAAASCLEGAITRRFL